MITIADLFGTNTEAWTTQARCNGHNPDTWFPHTGQSDLERTAKTICSRCPVTTECLNHALDFDEHYGIWGGLTQTERRRLIRDSRPPTTTPHCGTERGYDAHLRRRESTCTACRDATTKARQNRRAERAKGQQPPTQRPQCGTESGGKLHAYYGEQTCDPCRIAGTAGRRRRERERARARGGAA
ncbi:WhiB family transcriptional regulator [Mycobacterium malmoense]|uniref:WhiB family transcriptional regulator n=1 Tax=Mycobacterium malmoense TaxID=1780 RepID=UPI0008F8A0C6|nr:hypothetical protein BMG05_14975 [Mycobacterium malmoense]